MARTKIKHLERILFLAAVVVLAGLGWLAGRYVAPMPALPWILWAAGAICLLLALFAPVRWLRIALGMNLFTQDLFDR